MPLLGGETAEHPGLMAPEDYDIADAATGVAEAEAALGPEKVGEGDVSVASARGVGVDVSVASRSSTGTRPRAAARRRISGTKGIHGVADKHQL